MSKRQLRNQAKVKGCTGYSRLTKSELETFVRDCTPDETKINPTVKQLRELAKSLGLTNYSRLQKAKLIDMIRVKSPSALSGKSKSASKSKSVRFSRSPSPIKKYVSELYEEVPYAYRPAYESEVSGVSSPPKHPRSCLKGIVFDFDHTLSKIHLWNTVVKKLKSKYPSLGEAMIRAMKKIITSPEDWASSGTLTSFVELVESAKKYGIIVGICTYGNKESVKYALSTLDTSLSDLYVDGTNGVQQNNKVTMVRKFAKIHNIPTESILFVDDDPGNVSANFHRNRTIPMNITLTYGGTGLTIFKMKQLIDFMDMNHCSPFQINGQ
jgi:hypothetical protein